MGLEKAEEAEEEAEGSSLWWGRAGGSRQSFLALGSSWLLVWRLMGSYKRTLSALFIYFPNHPLAPKWGTSGVFDSKQTLLSPFPLPPYLGTSPARLGLGLCPHALPLIWGRWLV